MVSECRVVFDDKAKNDGELILTFTAYGQPAKAVHVMIPNKTDSRDAARTAANNLKVALGDGYEVDQSGDSVKVEGKKKAKFSLTVSSLTANGLSVRIK